MCGPCMFVIGLLFLSHVCRIEAYEERLREMQLEKKRIVKEAAESLKMAKVSWLHYNTCI